MAAVSSDRVRDSAAARDLPESVVFERALERGLEGLWANIVLSQYLDGDISRDEAIDRVGRAKVKRADRELEIVEADVGWGVDA